MNVLIKDNIEQWRNTGESIQNFSIYNREWIIALHETYYLKEDLIKHSKTEPHVKGRDNWLERRRNDLENNFFLNLRCLKYFLASLILVPEITSTVFKDIEIPPGECAIHNALDATMKNFGI